MTSNNLLKKWGREDRNKWAPEPPSKYQNPVAELESRLVLKACFSNLFGDNVLWFIGRHWHWLEFRFWLKDIVRLLSLLGFRLGLTCKMGIFMCTLQGCFRNKNRRIHVKTLSRGTTHCKCSANGLWHVSSLFGGTRIQITNTSWTSQTHIIPNAVPGVYRWEPHFLGSEGSSDDIGTRSGLAVSPFQIWTHLLQGSVGGG